MRGIRVLMLARKRNWFLALLFLGWALGNLDRYIMNYAVLSITEDLNLSASSTGILLSSFFAGYALMQLPGGWLADRFGARKVLITSVILWSIFTGLTGAAWSSTSMIVYCFLFGIGEGGFSRPAQKSSHKCFRRRNELGLCRSCYHQAGLLRLLSRFFPLPCLQQSAGVSLSSSWE